MNAADQRKLIGRLRRVAGQVRALEQSLTDSPEAVTNQMLAVIAASKAALRFYLEAELLNQSKLTQENRTLLARLLNRVD